MAAGTTPLDDDELIVGEAVALDVRPASVLMRGASALIDFLATVLVLFLFFFAAQYVTFFNTLDQALLTALLIALLVVALVIVPIVVEVTTHGRSLGRLALGLRVVRDDGGAIGVRHAFVRSLTGLLEIWLTLGGLAAVVGLLNGRGKRLGDLLAGTYAQVERVPRPIPSVWGVPVSLTSWTVIADVARLPDPLARRVSSFLGGAAKMTPDSRRRLAGALADSVARYVSPVPDADPELFLAAVSAIRRERESEALRLERDRMERLEPVLHAQPHAFPER
ncbi:RDD family protein [Amnibacterium flavum]|nr:RDD family protein [Amnibacterium flavum]